MPISNKASSKFFAPVSFCTLDEDGRLVELKFDAQFKRERRTETAEFLEKAREDGEIKHTKITDKYLIGWRAVVNEDKAETPFSHEAFSDLCEEYPAALGAVAEAWYTSNNPKAAAHLAAKN